MVRICAPSLIFEGMDWTWIRKSIRRRCDIAGKPEQRPRAMPHQHPHLPSARATNGFLALCTSYALFGVYILWALLPSSALDHPVLGWLPDQ
jgi:hypothetical protein